MASRRGPAAWLVDADSLSVNTIRYESKKLGGFSRGDQLVGFQKFENDVAFVWTAEVIDAVPFPSEKGGGLAVEVSRREVFEEHRSLSDLAFSLSFVYRYQAPNRHFMSAYRKLSAVDYELLVAGEVFWSRTAVGIMLNSLPRSVVLEFIALMTTMDVQGRASVRYQQAWRTLSEWIQQRYLSAIPIFQKIESFGMNCDGREGFDEFYWQRTRIGDEGASDNLAAMCRRFERLSEANRRLDSSVLARLNSRVNEAAEKDSIFDTAFGDKEWKWPVENLV